MRTVATLRTFAFSAIFGTAIVACFLDKTDDVAPAACDSTKCAAGNKCLALNNETKCRKTCSSNADPATSCPFGYTCVDTQTGVEPFCVQDTARAPDGKPLSKKPSGQWGSKCQANLGVTNPGCDTDQGFYCYGISPTDGDAYCTRYDCTQDSDCGAGFWCGQINQTPNVQTAKHSTIGEVQNVCLRRTYCATCKVDLDCPPVAGVPQHCVDDSGGARVCMPECDSSQACPNEASCRGDIVDGVSVCFPRALVCVGDGSLCSPCRVDTDCGDDGACVKGQYTTEKACAKKSSSSCGTEDKPTKGSCPDTAPGDSKAPVRCLGQFFEQVPADYCHGTYGLDKSVDIGCWTKARGR